MDETIPAGAQPDERTAALIRAWPQAIEQGSDGRATLVELLDALTAHWPQLPQALPSMAEAIQAIRTLVEDPASTLPATLPMALGLAHDRLADLALRQLLAAQGERGVGEGVPVPAEWSGSTEAPESDASSSDSPAAARDWWAIPVEGLSGANQIFILESRELMRGAEQCLESLRRDPSDYGEQMVLCRAFQAMAVASSSMGLRRLAALAQDGQLEFDRLLDEGTPPDEQVLGRTDELLSRLHAELLDLVGEPAAPVPKGPVPEDASRFAAFESSPEPAGDAERHTASDTAPDTALDTVPDTVPDIVPDTAFDTEHDTKADTTADTKADPTPDARSDSASGSASAPAMEAAPPVATVSPPPWWWAMDWSVWPAPIEPASGSDSPIGSAVEPPTDERESDAPLKLSAAVVQSWADRLTTWQRVGNVDAQAVRSLQDEIESATLVSIESWSVPLFRNLKRVMLEAGRAFDFDLEGVGVSAAAHVLQPFMPMVEAVLCERAAAGCGPLRLRASAAADSLMLDLVDLGEQPWEGFPQAVTPKRLRQIARLGGAWQRAPGGWGLRLPQRPSRLPLVVVGVGDGQAVLPRLWCQADESRSSADLQAALDQGLIERADGAWPLLRLSALMKAAQLPVADSKVLFLGHGHERLAVQVESVRQVGTAEPLEWPASLAGWRTRCGLWGAALGSDGPLPVTDPFALLRRYGAAARVLSRSRPARAA